MSGRIVAERYAQGLSKAIEDENILVSVLDSLTDLSELFEDHSDLYHVMANPVVSAEKRGAVIGAVLEKMQAEPIVVKFVQLLVGRGRLETLAGVRDVFSKLVDARLNRMTAEVTTALPLTQGQENRILAGLTSYTKQMVRITTATDPDIIGGIVVRLNGTIIDGSLRTRLDRAKQMLLAEEHEG